MTKFLLCVTDVNECKPPISVYCGSNAKCQNIEGSFYCLCDLGYKLLSGGTQFMNSNENTCQSKKIFVFLLPFFMFFIEFNTRKNLFLWWGQNMFLFPRRKGKRTKQEIRKLEK